MCVCVRSTPLQLQLSFGQTRGTSGKTSETGNGSAGTGGGIATLNTHYQFSPKLIIKTLTNLKYYPEDAFNEVSWKSSLDIQFIF